MADLTPGKGRPAAQREAETAMDRLERQGGPFVAAVEATLVAVTFPTSSSTTAR